MAKISVCIATYNGAPFIGEQLVSILRQLQPGDEVVVSDNGSTDDTLNIVASLDDERIRVLRLPTKEKQAPGYARKLRRVYDNFRHAILHATGDYIFLSDQDDVWLDGKIEAVIHEFESAERMLVVHDAIYLSSDSNIDGQSKFGLVGAPTTSFCHTLRYNSYLGCCMAFSRSFARFAFSGRLTAVPHDTWAALLACLICPERIGVIRKPLLRYRVHPANTSFVFRSGNSLWFKLTYRLRLAVFAWLSLFR